MKKFLILLLPFRQLLANCIGNGYNKQGIYSNKFRFGAYSVNNSETYGANSVHKKRGGVLTYLNDERDISSFKKGCKPKKSLH